MTNDEALFRLALGRSRRINGKTWGALIPADFLTPSIVSGTNEERERQFLCVGMALLNIAAGTIDEAEDDNDLRVGIRAALLMLDSGVSEEEWLHELDVARNSIVTNDDYKSCQHAFWRTNT